MHSQQNKKTSSSVAPSTHVFMIGICLALLPEIAFSWLQSQSLQFLHLRIVQATLLISWLIYCREQLFFGLTKPNLYAYRIFTQYALTCGIIGLGGMWLWPHMLAHLSLPAIAQGWIGLCLFILIGPLFEELFFRALLYRFIRTVTTMPIAIIISSSLFAIMHGSWLSPQLIGGIIFALAYEQSKNIWVAVVLHMAANAAVATLVQFA